VSGPAARTPGATGPGRFFYLVSVASLVALIVLCLAWELALAPLRPGGSWLALKALPLAIPLKGIVSGRIYTYRWAIMLLLAYFAEGCVRLYSESPPASTLALVEIVLSAAFFAAAIAYVRVSRAG
jgi:uncharacterized membrane protein